MAAKSRNIEKQSGFSIGRLHAPTAYQRGNGGIVHIGSAGMFKAYAHSGVVTTTGAQAFKDPALAGFGNDYFNGWVLIFEGNCKNTSSIVKGEMIYITDYDNNGTFTTALSNWSSTPYAGDEYTLIRMDLLPDGMIRQSKAITMAASTTGAVTTHEVLTVTGLCRIRTMVQCTTDLTGSGSIQYGVAGTTNKFIASTTGTGIDDTEIWAGTTPATVVASNDCIFDYTTDGIDIGYEVTTDTLTAGVLNFIFWWKPLESSAYCALAAGTDTLA